MSNARTTSSESRARTGTARVTGSGGRGAGAQRAVDRRQAANRKTQNARAQRMNAGAKPAASAAKPNGRQPRAITNGRSATMRQIRAKAVQARRMGQGKSTVASRNPGIKPDSARGQNIRSMSRSLRVIGDSGKVRAAEVQGRKIAAQAQARRGAKAASKRMEGVLKGARTVRNIVRGAAGLTRGGAAAAGLQAYNTGDGTLDAARKRGDLAKRRKPTAQEAATYRQQEQRAMAKLAERKRQSAARPAAAAFDDAFRDARRAGVKTFTWRGKKYTTDVK